MLLRGKYRFVACLVILTISTWFAPKTEAQELADSINIVLQHRIVEKDTMPHVNLKEIPVIPPYHFKNKRHKKRYGKFVRNIKVVLPYARSAGQKVNAINSHLDSLTTKEEKKAFLKEAERELFDEFEQPLRKLTFSQGKLLIKLINRETGDTSYELIKHFKGGMSAFFWQGVARLFGSNLKAEYHKDGDDKMIEHIILLVDNGII
ncbi:DUF4294 domain-containing protein [Carboxylicivirga sp. M1479]|uniref:DUF4294 domain-containing protein n=1 Tax=Carboxylicivirga sp. M1479 TaxID=2594476 RepID=UPI0011788ADB|nr:DUF4294 domain-containing protein [Carboxylicivirga sp. M1479]TRX70897.1 DUF4294 domain-containing protein [Carboxylicivirga sp. M1479]